MNRGVIIIAATGVLLIVGLAIGLAVVVSSKNNEDVCSTVGCVEAATRVLNDINPEVNPCDNFFDFACGGYMASAPLPEDYISADYLSSLGREIANQLRTCIEEPSQPDESRALKMAKNLYKTCMNTSALEKAGLDPLRKILTQFGNWPVVEGAKWREQDFDWLNSVYTSRRLGYSADNFFALGLSVDWTNAEWYILIVDQPVFGLSREFLIEGAEYFVVKAYYDYMVDVAVFLGADRQRATQELKESLEFEMKLANISLPEEERRNYTLLNNPMTVADLQKQYPFVNWMEYINSTLPSTVRFNNTEVLSVREPNFITGLQKLLKDTPKRVQANYAVWRVVADSVKYLTKSIRERESEYIHAMMNSVDENKNPRWRDCLSIVADSSLSLSVSALFVRKYFNEDARINAVEMVADIRKELVKTLEKADWMDTETKSKALEKTVTMLSLVGYAVELLDDNQLEKIYANLTQSPNDFLGNILELKLFDESYTYEYLRKPVNKSDWVTHDHSTEVNAFYDPSENSIHIPASVMQGVFYNKDRPRYMNYAAIGFLIGHEMSHSFDNEGRQFDKNGNLVDWWTPESAKKYAEKAQCIINQYNEYTVESVGLNVDGANTLGENFADNIGIKEAYLAYKEYARRNGPEPKLPGLKYSPEQMFWISAANVWCIRYKPEFAQYELTTDVHSPERFRVIGSFSNMPEFAADFNCPAGSYMNPVKKCSVF